nr:hypothetical protein [Tanacetum cinerariifolium]
MSPVKAKKPSKRASKPRRMIPRSRQKTGQRQKDRVVPSLGRKNSKTYKTTSGSASGGFNLYNEANESEKETQEQRPMGRDQAKAKKKLSISSRERSSLFVDLVADKFLNIKRGIWGKMKKQQESYIQLKNRELDI